MALFRKKAQQDIEAYQLTKELALAAITSETNLPGLRLASASYNEKRSELYDAKFICTTIHGQETIVAIDDWVITEPDGEHYYPCKPAIFAARYERSPQECETPHE